MHHNGTFSMAKRETEKTMLAWLSKSKPLQPHTGQSTASLSWQVTNL